MFDREHFLAEVAFLARPASTTPPSSLPTRAQTRGSVQANPALRRALRGRQGPGWGREEAAANCAWRPRMSSAACKIQAGNGWSRSSSGSH